MDKYIQKKKKEKKMDEDFAKRVRLMVEQEEQKSSLDDELPKLKKVQRWFDEID